MTQAPSTAADVVCDGTLTAGSVVVRYAIRQPAPTQWIAVGVVRFWNAPDCCVASLLVGVGTTEDAAIRDLARRLARTEDRAPSGDPGQLRTEGAGTIIHNDPDADVAFA